MIKMFLSGGSDSKTRHTKDTIMNHTSTVKANTEKTKEKYRNVLKLQYRVKAYKVHGFQHLMIKNL